MRVLMLAVNDPAGTAIEFCRALNAHTGHTARLATLETRYGFDYQADLHVPDLDEAGLADLGQAFAAADVLHFHMTADEDLAFGPFLPRDYLSGKAVVHHHHGHPAYRADPGPFLAKYAARGRENILVSTPDLLKLFPKARWQPNLVPQNDPDYLPGAAQDPERVVVAHSPTRRELKNTDAFLAVMARLSAEYRRPKVGVDLITMTPHRECLARKRAAHLLFDHMQGYYGVSSLEALSQARPVIAGLDDWNAGHMREFAGTAMLPFVLAKDEAGLEARLRELIEDADLRREIGQASRAFMEGPWGDRRVVARLDEFYGDLK